MKNKFKIIIFAVFIYVFIAACNNGSDDIALNSNNKSEASKTESTVKEDDTVLEIGEKMFIAQINEIYYNFNLYKDKTIVVEGMYGMFYSKEGEIADTVVYRNGPGCCGNDGWAGFFLNYDGETPKKDDWIRVIGTPELVEGEYFDRLYLNVSSLEVKTERGSETVTH